MVVGEFSQETDVAVIGGGPGGYSAAFRAAELGVQVVVVDERSELGGVCLHAGCIPSKALLSATEMIHSMERAREMGVELGEARVDFGKMQRWTGGAMKRLASGLEMLAKKHKVEVIRGRARFDDSRNVTVAGGEVSRVRFRRAVVATGSRSKCHGKVKFDGERVISPAEAVLLEKVPKTMLVVGSNYMSLEVASIYSSLGTAVRVVTSEGAWLPNADGDLVKPLLRAMGKRCAGMELKVEIEGAESAGERMKVKFAGADGGAAEMKEGEFEKVVISLGQEANTEGLNLERTGARVDEAGFVMVDETMRTVDPRIFAVGDVTGGPMLADVALAQGRVCGEVLADWSARFDARAIPMVAFTDPQVAWVGLTEKQAKTEGREAHAVAVPWGASGRAVGMGRTDGVTKIVFDPETSLVLGVGITGAHAGEMIGEAALAIEMGAVVEDLAATIHAHPSLHELISEAARASLARGE